MTTVLAALCTTWILWSWAWPVNENQAHPVKGYATLDACLAERPAYYAMMAEGIECPTDQGSGQSLYRNCSGHWISFICSPVYPPTPGLHTLEPIVKPRRRP